MTILQVDKLGQGGLIYDQEDHTLPLAIFTEGKNLRFSKTKMKKFKGSTEFFDTWALGAAWTVPQLIMPWRYNDTLYLLLPCKAKIVRADLTLGMVDVTRAAGGDYGGDDATIWSGGIIGGVPVLNNDNDADSPQSWDASTGKFIDLPNWTAGNTTKIVRVFKQYLVCFDYTPSGGTRQPHTIKWSNPANPGSVPTKWDNGSDNDSNERPLSEGGGYIIDAQVYRDTLIIFKEEQTWVMSLVTGPFVFSTTQLFPEIGMLAPRCAKNFEGKQFVVTKGDVIVHDGVTYLSVIDTYMREWFFENLSSEYSRSTFVVPYYAENEMWICFASNSATTAATDYTDTALIWNWKTSTWSIRDLPSVSHIAFGKLQLTSNNIDDVEDLIDNVDLHINTNVQALSKNSLLAAANVESPTGWKLVQFDQGEQELGSDMTSYAVKTGIVIVGKDQYGEPKVDPASIKLLNRLWLKMDASGPVNVYVGSQTQIGGVVTWGDAQEFTAGVTPHLDWRVQGKILALKIESTTNIFWSCTGFSMNVEVLGGATR